MKKLCILLVFLALLPSKTVTVEPQKGFSESILGIQVATQVEAASQTSVSQPVKEYGCVSNEVNRPCWPYKPHKSGWIPSEAEINDIIPRIIACESHGNSVKAMDSNNKYSYGITQIQKATWDMWSDESGITGNPLVPDDALRMTRWAVSKGYLAAWSCAYILGILVK